MWREDTPVSPQDQRDPGEAEPPTRSSSAPRIFISYRRDDDEGYTGRLYDALVHRFGAESVFMDIDTIPLGVDFTLFITEQVSSCDVLIAMIGRQWLTIVDDSGQRRIDNPEDFVHLEIKAALERDVRVIPALIQGAEMPRSQELPREISGLARRNGISLRNDSWRHGIERVIRAVEEISRPRPSAPPLGRDQELLLNALENSDRKWRSIGVLARLAGASEPETRELLISIGARRSTGDKEVWGLISKVGSG